MKAQNTQKEFVQLGVEQSAEPQLSVVKFHQTKISCANLPDGRIMVAIKPICDAIGLDSKHALLTIKKDTFLGAMVGEYTLLDASKRKFPMQCIPIEYVHGWLFTIQEKMIKEQAKPKLLQFKKECYQVLFDHFYGKYKVYEHNLGKRRMLISEMGTLLAQKSLLGSRISQIKKQLGEIEEMELTGQLRLNVGGAK